MNLVEAIKRIKSEGWTPLLEDDDPPLNGYGLYQKGSIRAHLVKLNGSFVMQRQADPNATKWRLYR